MAEWSNRTNTSTSTTRNNFNSMPHYVGEFVF